MKKQQLTEELRKAINEYLKRNYGATIPTDRDFVYDEGNVWLHIDSEKDQIFYIQKKRINITPQ